MRVCEELCATLEGVCPGEVVLEDRTHLTLGARRRDTELAGYPVTVVIGKKVSVLLVAFLVLRYLKLLALILFWSDF